MNGVEVERLRALLRYDKGTGLLFWLQDMGNGSLGQVAGWIDTTGYCVIGLDGVILYAHRVAWAIETGEWPEDEIDHINGKRADNMWSNLRSVAAVENQRNMKRAENNTSGQTGVSFCLKTRKWIASIGIDGECVYLGSFAAKRAAVDLRKAAERRFGYHANHGRSA